MPQKFEWGRPFELVHIETDYADGVYRLLKAIPKNKMRRWVSETESAMLDIARQRLEARQQSDVSLDELLAMHTFKLGLIPVRVIARFAMADEQPTPDLQKVEVRFKVMSEHFYQSQVAQHVVVLEGEHAK